MNNNKQIFIPGPSGRIQAKYSKSKQLGAPVALVLSPHPQYGGTMNNKIVYESISIPMPVYVDVTYNLILRSEYQQQMNEMLTPFIQELIDELKR